MTREPVPERETAWPRSQWAGGEELRKSIAGLNDRGDRLEGAASDVERGLLEEVVA